MADDVVSPYIYDGLTIKFSMRQLVYIFKQTYLSIQLEWAQFSILDETLQKADLERFAITTNINYSILTTIRDAIGDFQPVPDHITKEIAELDEIILITKGYEQ